MRDRPWKLQNRSNSGSIGWHLVWNASTHLSTTSLMVKQPELLGVYVSSLSSKLNKVVHRVSVSPQKPGSSYSSDVSGMYAPSESYFCSGVLFMLFVASSKRNANRTKFKLSDGPCETSWPKRNRCICCSNSSREFDPLRIVCANTKAGLYDGIWIGYNVWVHLRLVIVKKKRAPGLRRFFSEQFSNIEQFFARESSLFCCSLRDSS